jgi:hypothetical protein
MTTGFTKILLVSFENELAYLVTGEDYWSRDTERTTLKNTLRNE